MKKLLLVVLTLLVLCTGAFAQTVSEAKPLQEGFEYKLVQEVDNSRWVLIKFPDQYLTTDKFPEGVTKSLSWIFADEISDPIMIVKSEDVKQPNLYGIADLGFPSKEQVIAVFRMYDSAEQRNKIVGIALTVIPKKIN